MKEFKLILLIIIISRLIQTITSSFSQLCAEKGYSDFRCQTNNDSPLPVCAVLNFDHTNYTLKDFQNKCLACSGYQTSFFVPGKCDQFPKGVDFCHPNSLSTNKCNEEDPNPVCGYMMHSDNCSEESCKENLLNPCEACNRQDLKYFVYGTCSA